MFSGSAVVDHANNSGFGKDGMPPLVLLYTAAGSPAVVKRPIAGTPAEFWVSTNPPAYRDLARRHREGVRPVATGD